MYKGEKIILEDNGHKQQGGQISVPSLSLDVFALCSLSRRDV